jgi:hypothetical protein
VRRLSPSEEARLALLTASQAEVALLEITATGLTKSIMDATEPVRRMLRVSGIHDFSQQGQGPGAKAQVEAVIHGNQDAELSKASLYRPVTKQGDPRIWFYGLKSTASPGDILAVIAYQGRLHVANLTALTADAFRVGGNHSLAHLLSLISKDANTIPMELLAKLREIAARGPIPSVIDGRADTAIGRTLEDALGIQINSSKAPDYKGIELKSFRRTGGSRQVRKTLFAQVPDWGASKLKSSAEILDAFGYARDGAFKLYCQVEATKRNSQGLMFRLDGSHATLWENSDQPAYGDFAAWSMAKLHERLLEKHAETFWVAARHTMENGREHFLFTDVTHTRRPLVTQFDILIEQGIISMDHLIKRKLGGPAKEKGPLFKIAPGALGLLFPPPARYALAP